ncbi:hypothetical protein [Nocardioides euryhalodurans]|uniref:Uncharacterized protein n=1 Tax=Nocardioides euryhalodurans TaxID=2518370 RepID=A0A4P7GHU5_9ACTN|nr:hypothetical protein [Nocardioides euryhalodurans]QBR91488.1 hypothetical protein EXE57_03805 [Nocardioides euryhalodurans]
MPSLAFAIPVLPGKTDADREAMGSCWRGERRAAYEDARRRAGVTKEAVWIQATPNGDLAVVYLEADDLEAAFNTIGESGEPFDQWFRDHVEDVHGISLADGLPTPEPILDYDSGV